MSYMDMIYAKIDGIFEHTPDPAEIPDKLKSLVTREVVQSFKNGMRVKQTVRKANQELASDDEG